MNMIDINERQGNIDWKQMKEAGVRFVMLRVGYGDDIIDLQFRKNAQGCNDRGIPCGVYWFSYAYTPEMAEKEAECCIQAIEEYEISGPVCIDFEESSIRYAGSRGENITGETAAAIIEGFCSKIEELGYSSMYYSRHTGICSPEQICAEFREGIPLKQNSNV